MANPKVEIWGDSTTWIDSYSAKGLNTQLAISLKCEKPKVNDFGTGTTTGWNGSLMYGVDNGAIPRNQPLDETICPCGQDPDVSPWGRVALFNQNHDFSLTPSSIITTSNNINWFFGDWGYNSPIQTNNSRIYAEEYDWASHVGMKYEQWSPLSPSTSDSFNNNYPLMPYTYYPIKSLILSIEVRCIAADAVNTTGAFWVTLDAWKNTYNTYHICGMRLFIRNCVIINSSTLQLTYNDDRTQADGYTAGQLAVMQTFNIMNNGALRDTEFLTLNMPEQNNIRCAYIFDETATLNNLDSLHLIGVLPCWQYFAGQSVKSYGGNDRHIFYSIPYSADNYEKCMKIAALFGCYFTPSNKYTFDNDMTDADLCLSVVDENGVTHGQYTRGTGNTSNSLYTKSSIRDIDYDPAQPVKPVDTNTYSNTTGFNYITEGAAMTVRYVLDGANVDKLLSDLWTINASIAQGGDFEYFDGKIKDEYLTTNPIDCIVSLIRYPFNIPYQLQPLQSYVKLGKTAGTAKGWTTVYISNQINFQGINIFPRFGNCFLDYEPYTTYELYVPFCGTTKIRAADILGHTLNVSMLIDLITGSCTAYVKADQLVIETLQGSCGVQQQISGTDTATMNANIYNGILAQKQAKAGMIAQGASALLPSNWVNPVGYAAKGEQAETSYKQATFAIEHIETPVHFQGAASPLLGWIQEFDARLMIYYPEGDVIDSAIPPSFKPAPLAAFGHLKGFATVTPGTIGAFRSSNAAFISGDIIADNIPCTLSERNRIKSMFADGVYLPPL